MSADLRVSVTGTPWRLRDLERLCELARERGLPDDSVVSYSNSPWNLTVWHRPEEADGD